MNPTSSYHVLICYILLLASLGEVTDGFRVAMKIVESPMAYGFNNDLIMPVTNQNSLALQVPPQDFSGPQQLQRLVGSCFNLTDTQYQYVFCPFHNVTQFELTSRWNSYQGVLGVWQEWNIDNNTFSSMMMLKGDKCGAVDRSVEVFLKCGDSNGVRDVLEPKKCQYHLYFETPLVCHPDALLVYPRLPQEFQKEWDQLETELANEEITQKDYIEELNAIFVKAGYKLKRVTEPIGVNTSSDVGLNNQSSNYSECIKEVAELKREIEALKLLLELNRTVPDH